MINIAPLRPDPSVAGLFGYEYSTRFQALPIRSEDGRLWVAMADPTNIGTIADIADIVCMHIVPVLADAEELRLHISQLATDAINTIASQFLVDAELNKHNPDKINAELLAEISAAPAVRFIDSVLEAAIVSNASDIHIEPYGNRLRTRCRIDGHLRTYNSVEISILPNVLSRLKIMGGMDIAERRRPQDGRFSMSLSGEKIEFRLSTLPTAFGEKAAIRLLYDQARLLTKEELGFFPEDLVQLTELFHRPHGAIFVTGPTGSGKSTTLSRFMMELNLEGKNIVTVEDPVENPIMGVNHVNAERAAGFSFATILRHILRQDPDIIMVGEVRDEETAAIAMQAATTGHVVLCTIHTNDAAGIIERLIDMGIEPYISAHALSGVISQRLVRRICANCKIKKTTTVKAFGLPPGTTVYTGTGCTECDNTGYRGRIAVYEYIIFDENMHREMSEEPYRLAAKLRSQSRLIENAIKHVLAGNTTLDEIGTVLGAMVDT